MYGHIQYKTIYGITMFICHHDKHSMFFFEQELHGTEQNQIIHSRERHQRSETKYLS